MQHKQFDHDMKHSFPMLSKGMDRGYSFTEQYNPELAELLRQLFLLLMRPLVALRAKLYRTFLWPFRKLERSKVPVFRIAVILLGMGLVASKDISFSFSLNSPMGLTSSTSVHDIDDPTALNVNEYAPVGAGDIQEKTAGQYIEQYKDVAIKEMQEFGIPASITLGQALIESRAGNSRLARENHNHFGIKCFSRKCAKGHCSNHFDDHHKDFFRKYDSVWESYRSHSQFLSKGRYAHLQKCGKDYKKWATGLRKAGYATDKKYDKKLIGIIDRYKLYQYDK